MITDALFSLLANTLTTIVGWFPKYTPPGEITNGYEQMVNQLLNFHSLGVWVDWQMLNFCVLSAMASWFTGFIFKLGKQLLSHLPVAGGAG